MVTDTIADFLTRIRNAVQRKHDFIICPTSNLINAIAEILKKEKFIQDYELFSENKINYIKVYLRYLDGVSVIRELQRVSKPGVRKYYGYREIKPVMNGLGIGIYSTPKGVLTDSEAIKHKVGGEYICYVY
jgi:small subunit ribosomal protein S8